VEPAPDTRQPAEEHRLGQGTWVKHASGTVASMGGWRIHAARPGDGAGIASLHLAGGNDYLELDPTRFRIPDEDGLAEWLDGDLESSGGSWICFVAEEDGRIVGRWRRSCGSRWSRLGIR